ncbi:transposase [Aurantiacibacter atlanticus]|uniref:Transposase n=1 Tax=Aurantiacibacter atlanticus TaxID=1648404 RepID=A0A0H4VIZ2_9SPHN|nr:transposase [Aurantiacibacter atlanticus]
MPAHFDKQLYPQRHKIENLFARLKDWRRIHTRYDRRADIFMAAITSQPFAHSGSINES